MDIGIILASKPRNGLSGAASCAILSHKEARKIRFNSWVAGGRKGAVPGKPHRSRVVPGVYTRGILANAVWAICPAACRGSCDWPYVIYFVSKYRIYLLYLVFFLKFKTFIFDIRIYTVIHLTIMALREIGSKYLG